MYIPQAFEIKDLEKIANLIETYNFATLVTCEDGIPIATCYFQQITVLSHLINLLQ